MMSTEKSIRHMSKQRNMLLKNFKTSVLKAEASDFMKSKTKFIFNVFILSVRQRNFRNWKRKH